LIISKPLATLEIVVALLIMAVNLEE